MCAPGRDAGTVQHAAMLCRTRDELLSGIEVFVRDGARRGQAALVATAGGVLTELRSRLGSMPDRVTWADLAGPGGRPGNFTSAMLAFVDQHRGERVRCVQEPGWHSRPAGEFSEAVRHEGLINLALAGSSASVLCAFAPGMHDAARRSAERTHPAMARGRRWKSSRRYQRGTTLWREPGTPLSTPPATASRLPYRDNMQAVRRFAAHEASQAGLPEARLTDLILAVSELAANTHVHSGGPGALTIWTESAELVCQIEDQGHITDPLAGIRRPLPAMQSGGQGLWVVYQLADLTEIRTSAAGTTVRLHMRLAC